MSKKRQFSRRPPRLEPRKTTLIVCEGSKTEPFYFRSFLREHRIHGTVELVGSTECGSAPISLVDHALQLNGGRVGARIATTYDSVWIVCDVDDHTTLHKALNKASANGFGVALSNPCFEVWPLLHFIYSTRPLVRDALFAELRAQHIPNYCKGRDCFALLNPRTQVAITNARRLRAHHNQNAGDGNPSTDVGILVDFLLSLVPPPPCP